MAAVSESEFADLMTRLGPLGRQPRLAVGVSGGGDSLALTLLLHRWCRGQDGTLLALTVEHGLRPESADEARRLGRPLTALGIDHRILPWTGDKPAGAFERAARTARYALLQAACRRAGVIHLCLAHHAGDQAETLLLRQQAGSGPRGLAGMAAVTPLDEVLLLRPLLSLPHARLLATCRAAGLAWAEDPGNHDPASGRRAALRASPPPALRRPAALLARAGRLGGARAREEQAGAALLSRAVAWHPWGYARLDSLSLLRGKGGAPGLALSALLRCLGGQDYGVGQEALARALERLGLQGRASRGFTLGGCRLLPGRDGWLVTREERVAPLLLRPGSGLWDRRWRWRFAPGQAGEAAWLRPLGRQDWQALSPLLGPAPVPGPALWSLPVLADSAGPRALPALKWHRPGAPRWRLSLQFAPQPAGAAGFTVASWSGHII